MLLYLNGKGQACEQIVLLRTRQVPLS